MSIRRPKQGSLIGRLRWVVFRGVLLIRVALLSVHRVQPASVLKRSELDGVT